MTDSSGKMPDSSDRIKRIQRWIGAPQSGNLNDIETLDELEADIVGLKTYLAEKNSLKTVRLQPVKYPDVWHEFSGEPNMGGTIHPEGIVWHHSEGSLSGDIDWITKSSREANRPVSYHVLITENGERHHFVPLNRCAWHAGKSSFRGRYGCNHFMAGVAFTGSTYKRNLNDHELSSAREFVLQNAPRYRWRLDTMTDHRQVSPGRKNDLSPSEWQRLYLTLKTAF